MIYIFDDRSERRDAYMPSLLKHKNYIKPESLKLDGDIKMYIASHFPDPELVIIHSSYRFPGDKYSLNDVIKAFNDIPIVIFSGQIQRSSISKPENTYRVNSMVMYDHLPAYLSLKEKGEDAPIEILLWGKDYYKNQLLMFLTDIARYGINKDLDEVIDEDTSLILEESIESNMSGASLDNIRKDLVRLINDQLGTLTYKTLIDKTENLMRLSL